MAQNTEKPSEKIKRALEILRLALEIAILVARLADRL